MKQVPLALSPRPLRQFESFLPGPNFAALEQLQAELPPRTPHYLWGESGSGKSHLIQAMQAACAAQGVVVGSFRHRQPLPWAYAEPWGLLLFDDVQAFDADEQQAAFALCVEAQAHGVGWVAAGDRPPVDLPLREDLRTRLGWGQVHALQALDDDQTRTVLQLEAQRRGMALSDEVMNYLLSRFARDLASLMDWLNRLDDYSLSRSRAITVPLLRDLLAEASEPGPVPPEFAR